MNTMPAHVEELLRYFKKICRIRKTRVPTTGQISDSRPTVTCRQDVVSCSKRATRATPTLHKLDLDQSDEDQKDTFYPYTRLPFELRLKIWAHYLEDESHQIYRFSLRYLLRSGTRPAILRSVESSDRVYLQPVKDSEDDDLDGVACYLEPLWQSTLLRRIASRTCVEARHVVLESFPDTLEFRVLPRQWGDIRGSWSRLPLSVTGYPARTLRFNGTKDIMIFNASFDDQAFVAEIARKSNIPVEGFQNIRNMGLAVGSLREWSPTEFMASRETGKWQCEIGTSCTGTSCHKCNEQDYTRQFLSLFPSLDTFYLAGLPASSNHPLTDKRKDLKALKYTICPCSDTSKHTWPTIRSSHDCGWFMIYDERSDCPFPKFGGLERLREVWRPDFPYQAANGIEVRFIQPWPRYRKLDLILINCQENLQIAKAIH